MPSASGSPVGIPCAASANAATNSSWMPGAARTRVAAVQSWPALNRPAPAIPSAAASMSASSKTITGALPPSSRWTRLRSFAAEPATSMPARTEPVMATIWGVGCSTRARPVSRSPQTTLRTPGGRNSWAISASSVELAGVVSLGLRTTVLPAARAGAIFQIIMSSG